MTVCTNHITFSHLCQQRLPASRSTTGTDAKFLVVIGVVKIQRHRLALVTIPASALCFVLQDSSSEFHLRLAIRFPLLLSVILAVYDPLAILAGVIMPAPVPCGPVIVENRFLNTTPVACLGFHVHILPAAAWGFADPRASVTLSGLRPVDRRGFEPRFPACKAGVLPFDQQPSVPGAGIEPTLEASQAPVPPAHSPDNPLSPSRPALSELRQRQGEQPGQQFPTLVAARRRRHQSEEHRQERSKDDFHGPPPFPSPAASLTPHTSIIHYIQG